MTTPYMPFDDLDFDDDDATVKRRGDDVPATVSSAVPYSSKAWPTAASKSSPLEEKWL